MSLEDTTTLEEVPSLKEDLTGIGYLAVIEDTDGKVTLDVQQTYELSQRIGE